jgi:hypothetical protein
MRKKKTAVNKYGAKRPYESIYNRLVYKATKKGIPVHLTYLEFLELTKIEKCHYCETPIKWTKYNPAKKGTPNRCNLDRKSNDRSIGYTLDNVVVCCPSCNLTRGDRFSYKEFLVMAVVIKIILSMR